MKKIEKSKKTNLIRKIFIKICRIIGFEIIDQSNFSSPTLGKELHDTLSVQGKKSITIPLGQIDIKKKVESLKIIVRTCTSELIMDQNKRRIFDCEKNEYTFRTLRSLIKSINNAKKKFENISFELIVTDTNSPDKDLKIIKEILKSSEVKNKVISINLKEFKDKIKDGYSKAKFSNMANFYNSLLNKKNEKKDLIYFVEDDYLHFDYALEEMIGTYERISSQLGKDLFICPADYPFLYMGNEKTNLLIGNKRHWRTISKTLCTFMTSKEILDKYWENFYQNCLDRHDPFEKHLNEIYKKEVCISPVKSLSIHITNVNSSYGLSPFIDYKKLWEENE